MVATVPLALKVVLLKATAVRPAQARETGVVDVHVGVVGEQGVAAHAARTLGVDLDVARHVIDLRQILETAVGVDGAGMA